MVTRAIIGLIVLSLSLYLAGVLGGSVRHLMGSTMLDVVVGFGCVWIGSQTYFVADFILGNTSKKKEGTT
jgi:hypothetical protein